MFSMSKELFQTCPTVFLYCVVLCVLSAKVKSKTIYMLVQLELSAFLYIVNSQYTCMHKDCQQY